MAVQQHATALDAAQLRWRCDEQALDFRDTRELDPANQVGGQDIAWEALEFGIQSRARGQNVYVRGASGTGRMSMIRQQLASAAARGELLDRGYVHNFSRPDRPRLLSVPAGQGRRLRERLAELAAAVSEDLPKALEAEQLTARRNAIQVRIQQQIQDLTAPLEKDLREADMALVSLQSGQGSQAAIFPLVDGQPVAPEQLQQLIASGQADEGLMTQFRDRYPPFQARLSALSRDINRAYRDGGRELSGLNETTARELLATAAEAVSADFPQPAVATFLAEVADDVVATRLRPAQQLPHPALRYGINLVVEHNNDSGDNDGSDGVAYTPAVPIIEEQSPSLLNLLGAVEPQWGPQGPMPADYRGIHAGALAQADGGYLVLDAYDLLSEPGAWRALTRCLRSGRLEIVPAELGMMRMHALIKPEPIEIRVRVILVGDARIYHQLDQLDPDFAELFKVLADFDHELQRDQAGLRRYAAVLAQIARDEQLRPLSCSAVAALIEHGARIASRAGKLSARFGRIADIAREASLLAEQADVELTDRSHVDDAIQRTKRRASLPSRKFQELVDNQTIQIQTRGAVVGQINGLAVISAGPISYGFPARITASVGPGRAGLINIEGSASLSGSIHTKGFHILGGLLRYLLRTEHPLAFSASIAFEQSYGGIDGDSASGAEICCLLSALTDVPIRQSLAMTGAIDQFGHIQAIGGVNEKIEGFFDACTHAGLNGEQGAIIPQANAADLMLRADLVAACERGDFHVYAVANVFQALEVLTGQPAGTRTSDSKDSGTYADGTLLHTAVSRAGDYWRKTLASPLRLTQTADGGDPDDDSDSSVQVNA